MQIDRDDLSVGRVIHEDENFLTLEIGKHMERRGVVLPGVVGTAGNMPNVGRTGFAGRPYRSFDGARFAAPAAPPEADTAHGAHAEIVAGQRDADGLDRDRMEHVRQSRLARWQRQQAAR